MLSDGTDSFVFCMIHNYALTEIFNDHYVNIMEATCGWKTSNLAETTGCKADREIVKLIIDKYKDHQSIVAINQNLDNSSDSFSFHEVDFYEVWQLLSATESKKSTGEAQIPPRLVSLAAAELTTPLTIAINSSIHHSIFPDRPKRAAVYPLNKGESDQTTERNFRPISVLNAFSKIYEKVIKSNSFLKLTSPFQFLFRPIENIMVGNMSY